MRKNKFLTKLSSAGYVRNTYVHIWPTNMLTLKQKKMFLKRTKVFSAELGFLMKKKLVSNLFSLKLKDRSNFLELIDKKNVEKKIRLSNLNRIDVKDNLAWNKKNYFVNRQKKFSIEKIFFQKSFWFLKKTSLIPGGTRIMRTKSFNLVKKNSLKTLKVFLKSILKSKMQKLVSRTNSLMGFRHTWKFVHAMESLPLMCMQKAFLYKNTFIVLPILAQKLKVNSADHLAMPYKQLKLGDFFTNKHDRKVLLLLQLVNKSFYNYTLYQKI